MTRLAVLRCVGILYTGERCSAPAVPGTRRCQIHANPPKGRARCTHKFANGARCENRIPTARLGLEDLCPKHRQPCANPSGCPKGRFVARRDGLCRSCAAALSREAQRLLQPTAASPRQRWADTFASLPRCQEMSAETDQPCSRNALPGTDHCTKHRALPNDDQRCTHTWPNGRRCPKRWTVKATRRCPLHRQAPSPVGRPRNGDLPIHRPCPTCGRLSKGALGCQEHAPRCEGTTGRGTRCARSATAQTPDGAFCASHAARPVTPPPPPPAPAKPLCGASSGADGAPCRKPSRTIAGGPCAKHDRLPSDEDRCRHVYSNGDRCPAHNRTSQRHGSGQVCALHTIPCEHPDCQRRTANVDSRRCLAHTPLCSARVADGRHCRLPVVRGTDHCALHQPARINDGLPRCQHAFSDGSRCGGVLRRNGHVVLRELCQQHAVPCAINGCKRKSTFLNGICLHHRTRCSADGCQLPSFFDGLCTRHNRLLTRGPCSLLTRDGHQCQNPAVVVCDDDGAICRWHEQSLPPDEIRCAHRYTAGQQCALRTQNGTIYCGEHAPIHAVQCSWTSRTGERCTKRTVPRPGFKKAACESHRFVAADHERCDAILRGRQRCPGKRTQGTGYCAEHVTAVACGRYTATGEPCGRQLLVLLDGPRPCPLHGNPPPPAQRCTAQVAPGHQCPGRREHRSAYCDRHSSQRPRCIATDSRGVRCPSYAPRGFDTCDKHATWTPGQIEDPPEAYERFFLRPRLELLLEVGQNDAPDAVTDEMYSSKPESKKSSKRGDHIVPIVDYDPFDLTGAARMRAELVEDGVPEEEADRLAVHAVNRYAESTVRTLTNKIRPYLEFCRDNHLQAVPGSRTTIARFLDFLFVRGRVWDGEPLSSGTVALVRSAITRAHVVLGHPDPFAVHPDLVSILAGYNRMFARPPLQAHAVLLDELAALLAAARSDALLTLRDNVILTVLTDPEVGMNYSQAVRWDWSHTLLGDPLRPDQATTINIPFTQRPGFETFAVPNRIAAVNLAGHEGSSNEIPLQKRLCGTASIRSLAAARIASGLPSSGLVLVKQNGQPLGRMGVTKIVQKTAQRAGLPYRQAYAFDERAALLDAAEEPSLIALRDAAIMALSWWASLRRSETAALNVGDIGADSRGRGLVILVRKSKTDVHGEYVAVPYARDPDGRVWTTDLTSALHAWLDAYARHIGRPLAEDDPLFVTTRGVPERLGEASVGEAIKRWAKAAGLQAELGERISSHGFRAGYATDWLRRGKPAEPLARRQRRKSTASLLTYFRLADPFEDSLAFLADMPDDAVFDLQAIVARSRRKGIQ